MCGTKTAFSDGLTDFNGVEDDGTALVIGATGTELATVRSDEAVVTIGATAEDSAAAGADGAVGVVAAALGWACEDGDIVDSVSSGDDWGTMGWMY